MWGIGTAIFIPAFMLSLYAYDKIKNPDMDAEDAEIIRNSRIHGGKKRKPTRKNKRVYHE